MTMRNHSLDRRTDSGLRWAGLNGAAAALVLITGCGGGSNGGGGDLQENGQLRVTEDGATVSVHCDGGGRVHVETRGAQVDITGDCEGTDVEGSGNTVNAENAETADLQGEDNTVSATRIGELSVDGADNSVRVQEIQRIELEGMNSFVSYETGEPVIEQEGVNNSVSGP